MTVLLEDSAAVTGVLMVAVMLGLAQYTGNTVYDALGSIGISGTYIRTYIIHYYTYAHTTNTYTTCMYIQHVCMETVFSKYCVLFDM